MGKKGDSTRQHIRAMALELFAARGYTKVTMQEIGEKCGLSKGGLYRHYADKRELFTDLLTHMQKEEAKREAQEIEENISAVTILEDYLTHVRKDLCSKSPNISRALYEFCMEWQEAHDATDQAFVTPDSGAAFLSAQYERGKAILLSLMEYGAARGELHPSDPESAAAAVLFLVEGLQMLHTVMPVSDRTLDGLFLQIKFLLGVSNEK